MIETKITCDRCKKECTEKYYTIDICEHEGHSDDIFSFMNSVGFNTAFKLLTGKRYYCEECEKEIELFLSNKNQVDEDKCVNCRQAIDCINGLLDECVYKG